jgi:hypothetical protein
MHKKEVLSGNLSFTLQLRIPKMGFLGPMALGDKQNHADTIVPGPVQH